MLKIILVFLLGLIILLGAIILNIFASKVGLIGWYEFLKNPGNTDIPSYLWLFIAYPLALGVIAYYAYKFLHL